MRKWGSFGSQASGVTLRDIQVIDHYCGRAAIAECGMKDVRQCRVHGGWTEPRRIVPIRPTDARIGTKFANLGEQLLAIRQAKLRPDFGIDPRLRAATGVGESDPSGGGFAVQTDFAQSIWSKVYDLGQITQRVLHLPVTINANGIKVPAVDEASRATGSRFGGAQTYWVGEGDAVTATKPKFRMVELDLKKMMSVWNVTDELMEDASIVGVVASEIFSEETMFTVEDAIIRGTGAGMPQGIFNSNALITVAAEKGQATKTILYQNLLNMWSRMWGRSMFTAVWLVNAEIMPQLYAVSQTVGTAGVSVYQPAGGLTESPFGTLFGRPVIPSEYASPLGTPGDIILADFSEYALADKGGMTVKFSEHVRFTSDEWVFRLTYRVDGQSLWNQPVIPYEGSLTKSPFLVLAQR